MCTRVCINVKFDSHLVFDFVVPFPLPREAIAVWWEHVLRITVGQAGMSNSNQTVHGA